MIHMLVEFIDFNILAYDYINILYLDDDLEKNLVENLLNLIIVYIDNIIINSLLYLDCFKIFKYGLV